MPASVPTCPRRLRWSRALARATLVALAAWAWSTAPAAQNTSTPATAPATTAVASSSAPTASAPIAATGLPLAPLERGLPVLRTFLPRDYRGHEQIWAIAETDRGLLLFGNLHQVLEYDGLHWRAIPVPGGSYVRALAKDAAGTVWVAGVNELGRLVPGADGQLAYTSLRDRVPGDLGDLGGIWCVHAQPDGVYFQSNLALLRWDGAKFDVWRTDQKSTVLSFVFGDTLLVSREKGWFTPLPGGRWQQIGGDELGPWLPRFVLPGPAGRTLVGHGTKGIFEFDRATATATTRPTEIDEWFTTKKPYSGRRLADGRYLFTSLQGGAVLLGTDLKFELLFDESSGLVTPTIISSHLDRHGALWLGTDRGVSRVDLASPVTVFSRPHGLERNGAESLHRIDGRVVLSGARSMLQFAPPEKIPGHPQFRASLKNSDRFTTFLRLPDGLLASGLTGLSWIADGQPKTLPSPSGIREVQELRAQPGRFLATHLSGLASWRRAGGEWIYEGDWPEPRGEVRALAQDRDGAIWTATPNDGVRRIEPSPTEARALKLERFSDADGLPTSRSRVWLSEYDGRPLFQTEQGLYRFDERTRRFRPELAFGPRFADGSTTVRLLSADDRGGLWLAAEPRRGSTLQVLHAHDGTWTQLPLTDIGELGALNFLSWEKHEDREILWIGGQAMLRQVDLVRWRQQPPAALGPTLLRGIHAGRDRQLAPDATGVRVAATDNTLRFVFGTPGLAGETEPMHETRLRGFADGDALLSSVGERTFTNLPAGRYTFVVRGRTADGRWSAPAEFAFHVLAPWWATGWAWGGYLALSGVSLFGYVRWRIRRLTRERTRLEGIVADRTAELAAKNRELERLNRVEQDEKLAALLSEEKARLELLRYQLNPHFLFNSLNSIRALVFAHPEAAGEMVTRLAEFCRWTLTRGSDETATVADEIEMVRTYLDVEKVRWQDALVVTLDIDDAARAERLPQFLLLPLIENAIKYGGKTSPGTLEVKITIRLDGDALACEVANTGRWVVPAAESTPTSTLIGLDNLRQRLARHYGPGCDLEIVRDVGWVRLRLRLKRGLPAAPAKRPSRDPFATPGSAGGPPAS